MTTESRPLPLGTVLAPAMPRPAARERRPEPADGLRTMLRQVEDLLAGLLSDQLARWAGIDDRAAVPVREVARLIAAGGKRLRPRFCLAGYLAAGGRAAGRGAGAGSGGAGTAARRGPHPRRHHGESEERRARPTVHTAQTRIHRAHRWQGGAARYGESVAILAGDLAWVYADQLMADLPAAAKADWFELRTELVAGQMLDLSAAAEGVPDPRLARVVADLKSGRYTIMRPLLLGAALADRPDLATPFEAYGAALGEAFQLRDDLIDAFGDSSLSGKPARQDFGNARMTLLLSAAMQHDERIGELVRSGDPAELGERLAATGARAAVEERIGGLVREAQIAVRTADLDPPWQSELAGYAVEIAYRER
ncbi:polyprenyl synthetase family protein [Kitasatospora sp. NPDC017646]|uniref:polyprenyl synthetase family protein n=1 Tax=Kitasatospora sp. NPDC017646 TaxID=3364024 RepID=UPI0037B827AC